MFLLVKVSGHLAADASVVRAELYLEPPKNPTSEASGVSKAALYRLTAGTPAMQNASPLEQFGNTV